MSDSSHVKHLFESAAKDSKGVALKKGDRVMLKAVPSEGWDEEYGRFDDYDPDSKMFYVTVDEEYTQGPYDDGIREVERSQIVKATGKK